MRGGAVWPRQSSFPQFRVRYETGEKLDETTHHHAKAHILSLSRLPRSLWDVSNNAQ